MPHITNKHLSRRTVLKAMGTTVALPFLDAMRPARALGAIGGAAATAAHPRLVAIEMVQGSAGSTAIGARKNLWSPATVGRAFDLSTAA